MQGYIKDYRKEVESDIWMMPPLYHRVWQYLKYIVNHDDAEIPMRDGTFFKIKKGQKLTSVRQIAQGVGYYEGLKWKEPNPKTISKILEWLEKQEMIKVERGKGNRQYTLITLLNWETYQSKNDKGNRKETVDGEGRKQSVDINNNDKERIKNEEEKIPYSEIVSYLNQRAGKKYKSSTNKTKKVIQARWNEGHRLEDFKQVIDVCVEKWSGQTFSNGKMGDDYLQPSTLFNEKFDERLNWTLKQKPKNDNPYANAF